MKIDAAYSQVCYPNEVNAKQRSIDNYPGSQENQAPSFRNSSVNWTETPRAPGQPEIVICTTEGEGQPEKVFCTYEERALKGFSNISHPHNSLFFCEFY